MEVAERLIVSKQKNRIGIRLPDGRVWSVKQSEAEALVADPRFHYQRGGDGRILTEAELPWCRFE